MGKSLAFITIWWKHFQLGLIVVRFAVLAGTCSIGGNLHKI